VGCVTEEQEEGILRTILSITEPTTVVDRNKHIPCSYSKYNRKTDRYEPNVLGGGVGSSSSDSIRRSVRATVKISVAAVYVLSFLLYKLNSP